MTNKHLHIVCFDVPYPPDYGGVVDIFYRIKALHELGVKIHLHCFEYGRDKQSELEKYCAEILYYERYCGWKGFSFRLPYIVTSRANQIVLQNLLKDDYPILLEGIHCTWFLYTGKLSNRKVFVRLHNVESEYYKELAKNETSIFKKLYFKNESQLLRNYEHQISKLSHLLSINKKDVKKYQKEFSAAHVTYFPAFSSNTAITCKEGKGGYCLYHGNLSVIENEKAVSWLCKNVFEQLNIPFVIAGKNPSKKLVKIINQTQNVTLVPNPKAETLDQLISDAQINVLPSFNSTGIKIKLLNALFKGRHCLVNQATFDGTGLDTVSCVADTPNEFIAAIKQLIDQPLTLGEISVREKLLMADFDNKKNAQLLMQWIY